VHRRSLAFARLVATATIAGIAAWVSYWHMVGVAARYGESGASPYLLPLSVDGLIVVASICLVELGGRIAALEAEERGARPADAAGAPKPGEATGAAAIPGLIPAPPGSVGVRRTTATKVRRTPAETVALAARIKAERPALTDAELAAELGISTARWRTIRRESAQSRDLRLAA
jgi:hypothetical protein